MPLPSIDPTSNVTSLKSSRLLFAWTILTTGMVVVLGHIYLPLWIAAGLTLACVSMAIRIIRRDVLLVAPTSIVAFQWSKAGLAVLFRNGKWHEALESNVPKKAYVNSWLIVATVCLTEAQLSRRIVLLPDSLDPESARRMRVRLRWSREQQTTTGS